jgi:hypothetical protein
MTLAWVIAGLLLITLALKFARDERAYKSQWREQRQRFQAQIEAYERQETGR